MYVYVYVQVQVRYRYKNRYRYRYRYTVKKPCRNAPNSDADNGGAEPNDVGVGIFRPPRCLVRANVVHIGISLSFFYSV